MDRDNKTGIPLYSFIQVGQALLDQQSKQKENKKNKIESNIVIVNNYKNSIEKVNNNIFINSNKKKQNNNIIITTDSTLNYIEDLSSSLIFSNENIKNKNINNIQINDKIITNYFNRAQSYENIIKKSDIVTTRLNGLQMLFALSTYYDSDSSISRSNSSNSIDSDT